MGDFILRKDVFDRIHTSQIVRSNCVESNKFVGPIFPNSSGFVIINGSTVIVNSSTTCINASGQFKVIASNILEIANIVTINSSTTCINASGEFKINASKVSINSSNICINSSGDVLILINSSNNCINANGELKIDASTILLDTNTTINGSLIVTGPLSAFNITSGFYVPTFTVPVVMSAWNPLLLVNISTFFYRIGNSVTIVGEVDIPPAIGGGTQVFGVGTDFNIIGTLPVGLSGGTPGRGTSILMQRGYGKGTTIPYGSGGITTSSSQFFTDIYVPFDTTGLSGGGGTFVFYYSFSYSLV